MVYLSVSLGPTNADLLTYQLYFLIAKFLCKQNIKNFILKLKKIVVKLPKN